LGGIVSESKAQGPSVMQPSWVIVCSVGVGLSHRIGVPVVTVAMGGEKYGDPFSMVISKCGEVAVLGTTPNMSTAHMMTIRTAITE